MKILDLQKSCQDITVPIYYSFLFPYVLLISHITILHLLQPGSPRWHVTVTQTPQFIWILIVFPFCPFPVLVFHLVYHIASDHHVSLSSSGPCHFLRLYLFLMTLKILSSTTQIFYKILWVGLYLFFSSWLDLGYRFSEKDHGSEVTFPQVMQRVHINMTYPWWCELWLLGWGNVC